MKNLIFSASILILVCINFSLTGCDHSKRDWEKIKQDSSIVELQKYILQYPKSEFVKEAKAAIDTLNKQEVIPFKVTYDYIFTMPPGGLRSGVASGEWDPALCTFDPPIYAPGSFKFIKINGINIELLTNKIEKGIVKTKMFGDFVACMFAYRLDDGRSVIAFLATRDNIKKIGRILRIKNKT